MSLVYEALRKAEREKERKTGPAPAAVEPRPAQVAVEPAKPPAPVSAAPVIPNTGMRNLAGWLVAVGLLATVGLSIWMWGAWKSGSGPAQQPSMPAAAAAVATPVEPPPPATPPPGTTENDSRFKLTGIMGTPDGGFGAIINGRPVYQGHYVEGAIVKKIERDRVTLDLNGREIVVRLF